MTLTPRGAHFLRAEMAQLYAGALKRCLDLARAVLRAVSAPAVAARSLQHPVTRHLYSLRHLCWMRRVNAAVALAVAKVKDEADEQPDDQSHPICPAESIDHRATG